MHLSFINTRGQAGLDAPPITVEVHLSAGLPAFQVVGLGESRSREIRSRVRAALISSNLKWPNFNITINLTPAERVTPGTRFDLPIAVGLLVASQQLPADAIEGREFIGDRPRWLFQTQPRPAGGCARRRPGRHHAVSCNGELSSDGQRGGQPADRCIRFTLPVRNTESR